VGLEDKETLLELRQGREIIRGEDLSPNNRKVDLNLVDPTVNRSVNENGVRPLGAEAIGGLLTAMSGAVVHDLQDAAGGFIGL
jgi:hypothetical protein